MNLGQLFEESVGNFPDREAIVFGDNRINYRQLNDKANRVADVLEKNFGIGRGDRVAVLLKNHPAYAATLFGVLKLGAIAIPVNNFLAAAEVRFILEDSGVSLLISSTDFSRLFDDVKAVAASTEFMLINTEDFHDEQWLAGFGVEFGAGSRVCECTDDDEAVFVYTSGTTGKPKAAVLTHGNLSSNISSCVRHIQLGVDDVFLNFLPMFHSFTLMVNMFVPLSLGAKIVLMESIFPVEKVLEQMVRERCTLMVGIPQVFNMLAYKELPESIKGTISLRMCISGSAPLSEAIINAFESNFGIPLLEGYGLSEASPVVSVNPLDGVRKVGSVGQLLPNVEAKIFDEDDHELPLSEVGEIVLRGPNIMREYYRREEDTAAALRMGWLHTGDIGKMDEDGYLYIVDRKKDMLISKGMNIYPREIEELLYGHPKVKEAAVVGRMDETKSETPVAFISLREGETCEETELLQFLKVKLARYKIPREVIFIEEFPRTSTGKILKTKLREQLNPQIVAS